MRIAFRGVSSAALILGLSSGFQAALAQQTTTATPQAASQTVGTNQGVDTVTQPPAETSADAARDRVVVVGSIANSRESEELAIDVYTAEDFRNQGAPSIIEFVQSLTTVGESVGNMDITLAANGGIFTDLYGPGYANVNLRGLSDANSERTINLLNGRRTTGNANLLPTQVLQQVEILKDGASATYGAGAVGGVVNYVTRKDFDGLIIEGEQKWIQDIDNGGNQQFSFTWGHAGDNGSLLVSAAYEHTSAVSGADFDWANNSYFVNPAQYSTSAGSVNPGVFYSNSALAGAVPDITNNDCEGIGGAMPRTTTPHPQETDTNPATGTTEDSRNGIICYFNFAPFQNVVNETHVFRSYVQYESAISNTMRFHADLSYSKTDAPEIRSSPSQTPATNRSAYEQGGTGFPATQCGTAAGRCAYAVPTNHPAFADFITRANVGRGIADPDGAGGLSGSGAVINPVTTPGPYWAAFWRPFSYGGVNGSPFTTGFRKNDYWSGTMEVAGEFSEDGFGLGRFLPEGTTYMYSITGYNSRTQTSAPDIVSYRLQQALNGFGGPNCNAADLTPTTIVMRPNRSDFPNTPAGTTAFNTAVAAAITAFNNSIGTQNPGAAGKNGCHYYNPFRSAWPANAATGAPNPAYNAALANDPDMVRWLYNPNFADSLSRGLTFNAEFNGPLPGVALPGGEINWALGFEWRQTEYDNQAADPIFDARNFDCPWDPWVPAGQLRQQPGGIGCDRSANGRGPGVLMNKALRNLTEQDRQITSAFTKWNFPILDNWSATGTVRYEEISGSIGDFVYAASTKYDVFDWLSARGSWSLNFAAPNPDILDNDGITEPATIDDLVGPIVPVTSIVQSDISVETAEQFQLGFIADLGNFISEENSLRVELSYWNYFIEGEIASLSASSLTGDVFTGPDGDDLFDTVLDCASPLLAFITLSGPCVQADVVGGVLQNPATATTAGDVVSAQTLILNGPGIKTSGVDLKVDYRMPLAGGFFSAGVDATRLLESRSKAAFYQGLQIGESEDWLGYANVAPAFGTGKQGSRWRATFWAGYSWEGHTVRASHRVISAVDDERGCATIAGNGTTTGGGTTCFGVDGEDYWVSDLNWRWQVPGIEDFEVRATVLNVFDEDPPSLAVPNSLPFNAYIASPYGRQFEIGFTKTF